MPWFGPSARTSVPGKPMTSGAALRQRFGGPGGEVTSGRRDPSQRRHKKPIEIPCNDRNREANASECSPAPERRRRLMRCASWVPLSHSSSRSRGVSNSCCLRLKKCIAVVTSCSRRHNHFSRLQGDGPCAHTACPRIDPPLSPCEPTQRPIFPAAGAGTGRQSRMWPALPGRLRKGSALLGRPLLPDCNLTSFSGCAPS
jgi:hypothetical protein